MWEGVTPQETDVAGIGDDLQIMLLSVKVCEVVAEAFFFFLTWSHS